MSNHNNVQGSELPPLELDSRPWPESASTVIATRWHPKLTGVRLLVIVTTIVLGTAKAAMTYQGDTVAPVTIEWVITIVVFIMYEPFVCSVSRRPLTMFRFLVLGALEAREDAWPKWFFKLDSMDLVWWLLRRISVRPPRYQTEEADSNLLFKPKHPALTGYRILVTLCVVGLGTLKAGLSYRGNSTEPTTIEWVLGVVITVA